MFELRFYRQARLEPKWYYQILSFVRVHWPRGFGGENLYRDWISRPAYDPVGFVLTHGDLLVAHAQVLHKDVQHEGETFSLYGLSTVFTYPSFRGQGHGQRVVLAAMEHMLAQPDIDLAMTNCVEHNVGFYEKCGWRFVDNVLLMGSRSAPEPLDERVALIYVSDKAQAHQQALETVPIYFEEEW